LYRRAASWGVTHTIPKLNENEKKKHLDALQLPLLTDIFLVVPLCFAKEYVERPDTRTDTWMECNPIRRARDGAGRGRQRPAAADASDRHVRGLPSELLLLIPSFRENNNRSKTRWAQSVIGRRTANKIKGKRERVTRCRGRPFPKLIQ
jgi:hypothetical protein